MAQQIKILTGNTLEELEVNVNRWMIYAETEGFAVDYLGEVRMLGERFIYVVDYREFPDDERGEHVEQPS